MLVAIVSSSIATDEWSDTWEFEYADEEPEGNPEPEDDGKDGYQPQNGIDWTQLNFSGTVYVAEDPPEITWTQLNFSGTVYVSQGTIVTEISPPTWDADNPNCGDDTQNNFTFYQNGTATINITIGCNDTNYTFVSYATWTTNGHDQWCANFTIDDWVTETNIATGYPPTTVFNTSVAGNTNFTFGIRIWPPKTVTYANLREDFVIVTNSTYS